MKREINLVATGGHTKLGSPRLPRSNDLINFNKARSGPALEQFQSKLPSLFPGPVVPSRKNPGKNQGWAPKNAKHCEVTEVTQKSAPNDCHCGIVLPYFALRSLGGNLCKRFKAAAVHRWVRKRSWSSELVRSDLELKMNGKWTDPYFKKTVFRLRGSQYMSILGPNEAKPLKSQSQSALTRPSRCGRYGCWEDKKMRWKLLDLLCCWHFLCACDLKGVVLAVRNSMNLCKSLCTCIKIR